MTESLRAKIRSAIQFNADSIAENHSPAEAAIYTIRAHVALKKSNLSGYRAHALTPDMAVRNWLRDNGLTLSE